MVQKALTSISSADKLKFIIYNFTKESKELHFTELLFFCLQSEKKDKALSRFM